MTSSIDRASPRHRPAGAGRWRWFSLGALTGAALVAAALALWTAAPIACTTVGYTDTSAIRLNLPEGIGADAEVSACFNLNCTPLPLEPDHSGEFTVPQEEPFLGPGPERLPVSTTGVYVSVRDGGGTVAENRFGITTVSDAPFWSRCPGPFHYAPVTIGG